MLSLLKLVVELSNLDGALDRVRKVRLVLSCLHVNFCLTLFGYTQWCDERGSVIVLASLGRPSALFSSQNGKLANPCNKSLMSPTFMKALCLAYISSALVTFAQTQQTVDETSFRPRVTPQQGMEIQKSVSDYILQSKRVDVSGHVRDGTIVRPYSRQPAGGITSGDKLAADLWGIAAVALVGVIDYGLQKWEKRKSVPTVETLRDGSVHGTPDTAATAKDQQQPKSGSPIAFMANSNPNLKFIFVDSYIRHLREVEPSRFAQLVYESIERSRAAGTAYGFKHPKVGRVGIVSSSYLIYDNQGTDLIVEIVEESNNSDIAVGDIIFGCNGQMLAPNSGLGRLIYNSPNPVGTHSLRVIRNGEIKETTFTTTEFVPTVSQTWELQNDEACYEVALNSLMNSIKK